MRSPGRPPVLHRSERRPFWQAIADGCSSEDAARRAGVSSAVGVRWFRECGGMPPSQLAPSAPPPTGRYLSLAEREQIALLRAQRQGVREIARQLARSASTISRELRRNAATRSGGFEYRAITAQWHADRAARRPKPAKLATQCCTEELCPRPAGRQGRHSLPGRSIAGPMVAWKGRRHGRRQHRRWARAWSPEQIAHRLPIDFPRRYFDAHQPRSDLPGAVHPRARRPSTRAHCLLAHRTSAARASGANARSWQVLHHAGDSHQRASGHGGRSRHTWSLGRRPHPWAGAAPPLERWSSERRGSRCCCICRRFQGMGTSHATNTGRHLQDTAPRRYATRSHKPWDRCRSSFDAR